MSVAILILLSWVSGLYLYALDHADPVTSMPVFCKMRIYVLQASALTYRWCLTVACFDRFALTTVNVNLRNLAQVSIARRAVIVIVAVWTVLPMHSLILYNLRGNTCGIIYSSTGALYHSIFTTVAAAILPAAIMATCALLIYRNLLRKQKQRQLMNGSQERSGPNEKQRLQSRRDQQVLLMLLIQAICYVGTTTPLMGMYFYNALTIYVSNKSADRIAIERFSFYLAELINFLFPASSFYLYTISSNIFRRELANMLCSAFHHPIVSNTTRVLPMTNDVSLRTVTEHGRKVKSRVTFSTAYQEPRKSAVTNVQQ
ncbi:unnamed protein product [Rotaria sordida]|uniref:G-protein coupled receptors family 1 profile domain-containing protein n=1 Tax=Rotaria sordida TaxID=392033 RepID=A0A819U8N4_9BILA|nr:unnamed protein product [Rotaria sordida]CAF4076193.1 unnamed protein product [Rotaria sordida]